MTGQADAQPPPRTEEPTHTSTYPKPYICTHIPGVILQEQPGDFGGAPMGDTGVQGSAPVLGAVIVLFWGVNEREEWV